MFFARLNSKCQFNLRRSHHEVSRPMSMRSNPLRTDRDAKFCVHLSLRRLPKKFRRTDGVLGGVSRFAGKRYERTNENHKFIGNRHAQLLWRLRNWNVLHKRRDSPGRGRNSVSNPRRSQFTAPDYSNPNCGTTGMDDEPGIYHRLRTVPVTDGQVSEGQRKEKQCLTPNQPMERTPPRCALRRRSSARWAARRRPAPAGEAI